MPEALSRVVIPCVVCFLAGSIPFAVLAMAGSGIDIRTVGSGNPGFNNVLRVSKPRALIALAGDLGKGLLPVGYFYMVRHPGEGIVLGWVYGFAAVLGHCYSPWLKFHGGKGIATSAGVMLILYPVLAIMALVVFVAVRLSGSRLRWREAGALASLSSWVFFTLTVVVFRTGEEVLCAVLMTLLLAWRHKKNLRNLSQARQAP